MPYGDAACGEVVYLPGQEQEAVVQPAYLLYDAIRRLDWPRRSYAFHRVLDHRCHDGLRRPHPRLGRKTTTSQ